MASPRPSGFRVPMVAFLAGYTSDFLPPNSSVAGSGVAVGLMKGATPRPSRPGPGSAPSPAAAAQLARAARDKVDLSQRVEALEGRLRQSQSESRLLTARLSTGGQGVEGAQPAIAEGVHPYSGPAGGQGHSSAALGPLLRLEADLDGWGSKVRQCGLKTRPPKVEEYAGVGMKRHLRSGHMLQRDLLVAFPSLLRALIDSFDYRKSFGASPWMSHHEYLMLGGDGACPHLPPPPPSPHGQAPFSAAFPTSPRSACPVRHALPAGFLEPHHTMLEWGSGGSTILNSALVGQLYSVEHNQEWCKLVQCLLGALNITNVKYYCSPVAPGTNGWKGGFTEGTRSQFKDYVSMVHRFNRTWDRVLVDGRARVCPQAPIDDALRPDLCNRTGAHAHDFMLPDARDMWLCHLGIWPHLEHCTTAHTPNAQSQVNCAMEAVPYLKKGSVVALHDFWKRPHYSSVLKYYTE
eukprot:gene8928-1600_t